jgi:assimilatory nitrate reductase catalytic subunit
VNEIVSAVVNDGCTSVEAVGAFLQAGTSCGSCRPEIRKIVAERAVKEAV